MNALYFISPEEDHIKISHSDDRVRGFSQLETEEVIEPML